MLRDLPTQEANPPVFCDIEVFKSVSTLFQDQLDHQVDSLNRLFQ